MNFNFAPEANQSPAVTLMPVNTLALTIITDIKTSHSKNSGGYMAQLEFTVARGPFEKRKVWKYIGDPGDEKNSEKWRQMCLADLQHLLESAGVFNPADPTTYAQFANASFDQVLQVLSGKPIAITIGIEKGTDGNEDRNSIKSILSPNPNGRTHAKYAQVRNGDDEKAPATPQGALSGFGQQAPTAAAPATGFAQPAAAAQAAPAAASGAPGWLNG